MTDASYDELKLRATAAEKTLDILKKKVVTLYDQGVESIISRQLERAKQREISNQRRRELMRVRQEEMKRYTEVLEEEVQERTRAIRTILDNVTFGFLLVDRDLSVCSGFSASCWDLFGTQFAPGESLVALAKLGSRDASSFALLADQVFEDILPEQVSLEQLPQRFEVGSRVLRLEAKAIRADSGKIESLLITVSDVTALESARRDARRNETIITILSKKAAFARFLADTRLLMEEAMRDENQANRRRVLHTIKGNSYAWGMEDLGGIIHNLEDSDNIDAKTIATVEDELERYTLDISQITGIRYRDTPKNTLCVEMNKIRHLRRIISDLEPSPREEELQHWANSVTLVPAGELLGPIQMFTQRLAVRLGKEVTLRITGEETPVDPDALTPIFRNITHLLRNSLDHGIEDPSQRGHKPLQGEVEVRISATAAYFNVEVRDDGRGIDLERLSSRALSLGLATEEKLATWTDEEKFSLIFADGLSSADEATEVSGRGVGMAAIRAAARRQAGDISVRSTPGEGTSILVRVPRTNHFRRHDDSAHSSRSRPAAR